MILLSGYQSQAPILTQPIDRLGDARSAVFKGFSLGLKPTPPLNFTQWATENIQFGKDSEFEGPYNPDLFPFYREPLECLQPDHPSREVVLKKSAQIGGTIIAQVFAGACLDQDPGPFAYIHPSLDNGKRWVRTKWNPFVKMSVALRKIFSSDRSRDTSNSIFFKERKDNLGYLLISGANSSASLSMFSVPRQIQDDLSKWENNEAGDSETQADSRSNGFIYAKILKLSTPLIEGTCRIDRAYSQSDQRIFKIPCPHCDHKQELTWDNLKASLHEDMDYNDAHFTCVECGVVIEHHHKRKMVAKGEWEKQNVLSNIPGFYIWSAYSPLTTWARIAERYFKVVGDPDAEKTFYNDWLGIPYAQQGEAPPWENIRNRANSPEGYQRGIVPNNGILICVGVDVQGDRVEWHAKGFGENLQRFTIDYGVIEGHISETAAQKGLDVLLKRKFKTNMGRYVDIDMLAIDANYHTEDVLAWAKRHPENQVIAVRGSKGEFAPPLVPVKWERKKGMKRKRRQKRFFNVGVSPLKASLFKHLEKKNPEERGFCGYPMGMEDDFYIQLCSERRMLVTNKRTHYAYHEWQKLPGVRNEVLDTEIYAEAGARRLGWTELSDEKWAELRALRESAPSDIQTDLFEANIAKNKSVKTKVDEVDGGDDGDHPILKKRSTASQLA